MENQQISHQLEILEGKIDSLHSKFDDHRLCCETRMGPLETRMKGVLWFLGIVIVAVVGFLGTILAPGCAEIDVRSEELLEFGARVESDEGACSVTGVELLGEKYLVSAGHCVREEMIVNGVKLEVLVIAKGADVSIYRPIKGVRYSLMRDSALRLGENVRCFGNPLQGVPMMSVCSVAFVGQILVPAVIPCFLTPLDCTVIPGFSGGGCFDNHGLLVGIVSSSWPAVGTFGWIVRSEEIQTVIESIGGR